ncbi:MAG: 16S rRNA (cytidine(1402)-2'-O)-methyltransferase [Burkholderia sp.]|nr:MAG: Ribosomal RNA small subunit methyltransferase I [Burkholderia gladioli]
MTALLNLAQSQHYPAGTLYVVATPIGNAADITLRALHVLALVDRIAAEDTRNTGQLLSRYGISKPLLATVHEHNEREAAGRIVELLLAGERIAYVSDAGTPGISDPGAKLVDAVRAAALPVVPLPGANAVATVVSIAGDWAGLFTFSGFLPPKPKQRAAALTPLKAHPYALVFYEAPHRIVETVEALSHTFGGERRLLIGRELTKLNEDVFVGTLTEGAAWLAADTNRQRGEFAIVVEGARAPQGEDDPTASDALLRLLLSEISVKGAVKLAAALTGVSRNALYARVLELKEEKSD